jgi:hypothetical protein
MHIFLVFLWHQRNYRQNGIFFNSLPSSIVVITLLKFVTREEMGKFRMYEELQGRAKFEDIIN